MKKFKSKAYMVCEMLGKHDFNDKLYCETKSEAKKMKKAIKKDFPDADIRIIQRKDKEVK